MRAVRHVATPLQQSVNGNILVQRVPMDAASAELIPRPLFFRRVQQTGKPASGTPIILASLSSTHIVVSSKLTRLAEILMPSLQKQCLIGINQTSQLL